MALADRGDPRDHAAGGAAPRARAASRRRAPDSDRRAQPLIAVARRAGVVAPGVVDSSATFRAPLVGLPAGERALDRARMHRAPRTARRPRAASSAAPQPRVGLPAAPPDGRAPRRSACARRRGPGLAGTSPASPPVGQRPRRACSTTGGRTRTRPPPRSPSRPRPRPGAPSRTSPAPDRARQRTPRPRNASSTTASGRGFSVREAANSCSLPSRARRAMPPLSRPLSSELCAMRSDGSRARRRRLSTLSESPTLSPADRADSAAAYEEPLRISRQNPLTYAA